MAQEVDMELKKAFQELQVQMINTKNFAESIQVEMGQLKGAIMGMDVTQKKIQTLPADTRIYQVLGRAFHLQNTREMSEKIGQMMIENDKRIKALENNKTYHENKLKESEKSLRELVETKKQKLAAK